MKQFLRNILFTILPVLIFTGCSSDDDNDTPTPECPRSVLVYMVANNSLGSANFDSDDLAEMVKAARQGDFGNARLIVYHHPRNANPVLKEITSKGEITLKSYDQAEFSVSSARMNRVISDFMTEAPASHHGIIFWSHGSGWIENGIIENSSSAKANNFSQFSAPISPLSFGDDGGRYMNVTTLARVLDGKGFDYIYFDCCYMAGIEVVYELRHCAPTIVGSATELPAAGMPYDKTLKYLLKADADLITAAKTTFNTYDAMSGMNRSCTISVIDTKGLDALADATRAIYIANNTTSPDFSPQYFMTSSCYLFDFGQYVNDLASQLPDLAADFNNALDDVVIYKAATPQFWEILTIDHHSGLSTFIPNESQANKYHYDNLQWADDVASALDR